MTNNQTDRASYYPADTTKLHNEVNQYINQRFSIAMTSIIATTAILGWIVARGSGNVSNSTDNISFYLAILLFVILIVLFIVCQIINTSMNVISSYLREIEASFWENKYQEFCEKLELEEWYKRPPIGQGEWLRIIFIVLGGLTAIIPGVVHTPSLSQIIELIVVFLVYTLLIYLLDLKLFNRSQKIRKTWKKVFTPPTPGHTEDAPNKQLQQAWCNGREIIRNENDLINHRTTTFLTLQGLLFVGSVTLINTSNEDLRWLSIVLILILIASVIGFISSRRTQHHVQGATRQIHATSMWWTEFRKSNKFREELPFPIMIGIVGTHKKEIENYYAKLIKYLSNNDKRKIINPPVKNTLPIVMQWIWGVIIGIILVLFLLILIFPSMQSSYLPLWGTKDVTKIIITEGQNNSNVTISFKGKLSKISDLEKRIKAIP